MKIKEINYGLKNEDKTILLISASHEQKQLHAFSYHFKEVCRELGFTVHAVSPYKDGTISKKIDFRFGGASFSDYYTGKKRFPLSRILRDYPNSDVIIIENPKFPFDNDVNIPVFYYHRDLQSPLYVRNPTHLGVRFWSKEKTPDGRPKGGQPELLEIYHPEVWYDNEIKKIWFTMAISREEFSELNVGSNIKRDFKGFAYYGSYKSVDEMMPFNNVHYQIYHHHKRIIDYIEKNNLATEFRRVNTSLQEYRQHLYQFDATVIIPAWDSWETRRLYEASFCKCVPLLYIQNENARKVFAAQGYIEGETCITFEDESYLEYLKEFMYNDYDFDSIRKKGYELVTHRHTYKARIVELAEKLKFDDVYVRNKLYKQLLQKNFLSNIEKLIEKIELLKNRSS